MPAENLAAFTGKADAYAAARPGYAGEAVDYLLGFLPPGAAVVDGTAENTTLPDGGVHAMTCVQAFHWFDAEAFQRECARILSPGGRVFIVYNTDLSQSEHAGDDARHAFGLFLCHIWEWTSGGEYDIIKPWIKRRRAKPRNARNAEGPQGR